MKELLVSAIKNGTSIDHLPTKSVFKIAEILSLASSNYEVSLGTNLKSKKLGKKGVIKVSNITLDQKTIDKIALLAEGATISTIKNFEVAKKTKVQMPNQIVGIARCFNPNCITNHESATTKFQVIEKEPLKLLCHYCEKIMNEADLSFL